MWIPSSSTLSTRFLTPAIFLEISHVTLTPSGRMIVTELALLEKLIYTSFSNTARPRSSTVLEATALSSQPANTSSSTSITFFSPIALYLRISSSKLSFSSLANLSLVCLNLSKATLPATAAAPTPKTTLANPCFFAIVLNPPCSHINILSALSPQNLASVYHITPQKINANTHIHNNSVCIDYTHAKVL